MSGLYDRYQSGFYKEVYDELMAMHEHIFDDQVYEDALLVAKEIMKRVRFNIEMLISRLQMLEYNFGEGFWNSFDDVSPEEKAEIENDIPIFRLPIAETSDQILLLEQLAGTLPLSLKCWYEEVGSVNLIGWFPLLEAKNFSYGCVLDPLFVYSISMAIRMVTTYHEIGGWEKDSTLPLSPDRYYKYGFSGTGTYAIVLPCKEFDAILLREDEHIMFINYLRTCFKWGGFPGLETAHERKIADEVMTFLTKGLLSF